MPRCCRRSAWRASLASARSWRRLPAFALVRDSVLTIGGGPLVSLAIATNLLAALTGSASGGLTIALDALGEDLHAASPTRYGIDPALMHRVAVIGAGTLDSLPHNGAVVTLLAVAEHPQRELFRHLHGRHRRRHDSAGGRDPARDRGRVVLDKPSAVTPWRGRRTRSAPRLRSTAGCRTRRARPAPSSAATRAARRR